MKDNDTIKQEWEDLHDKSFLEIEAVLRKYDYNALTMLSSFVASICDVDTADLLTSSANVYISQCRALFWYAYRYMTQDPYERISKKTAIEGCRFSPDTVRKACEKITELINADPHWKGRWINVKRFIRLKDDPHSYQMSDNANPFPQKYKLMLHVPKEIKDQIEIEIKEK